MSTELKLGLKVGDLAEARSFQTGFRGAWFRCRIMKMAKDGIVLEYLMEYYDYPGEKDKWIRVYQLPPFRLGKRKTRERELMVRPRYPNILNQNEMPGDDGISEKAVVIDNSWQVGDLVDWWTTSCWWSGTILQLLDDDKAQIVLKPPPFGEGETYEILLKDVRPSLNWDPEHGWMLPTQVGDTDRLCPRLIGHINPVDDCGSAVKEPETSGGSSVQPSFQPSSGSEQKSSEMHKHSTEKTASDEVMNSSIQEKITRSDSGNNNSRKRSIESNTSSGQSQASVMNEDQGSSSLLKSFESGPGKTLHSLLSDSTEAAVLDLQGLLNKVKLLKQILLQGTSRTNNTPVFQWEFVDKSGASSHPNNSE